MNSLHIDSGVRNDSPLSSLDNPKRGDIVTFGDFQYRYTAMGGRWQEQKAGVQWNRLDYTIRPFKTTEELQILQSREQNKDTVNKILENENQEDREGRIANLWEEIVKARRTLEASRDGTHPRLSQASEKNIEETIEKMLAERKRLIQEHSETPKSIPEKKQYPIALIPESQNPKGKKPENPSTEEPPNLPSNPESPNTPEVPTPPEKEQEPKPSDNQTPVPPSPSPDVSKIPSQRNIQTNISEVHENLFEIANARAEERLRSEHKKSGFFGKAKQFFMRARLLEKYRNEELTLLRNQNIFDKNTAHIRENASDRFQKANEVLQKKDIQTLESISDQEIDTLSNDYVEGNITREGFEEQFMEIISSERLSKKLESLRQKGTNILKYLDLQKSWRVFLRDLPDNLDEITVRFGLFISSPQNKKILEESLGLDTIKDREKIIALLLHPESRSHIQKQKISITLDILTGGEEAFAIRNTDKTDTRAYASGKWLQKHSILSTIATGVGIGASSILAGPLGNLISGTFGIGTINGLRRNAEYTDEHAGFEKRVVRGNHKKAEIYDAVERLRSSVQSSSGMKKVWLEFRLKRAEEKLKLFEIQGVEGGREGTTHRHFASIGALNNKLQAYISEKDGFRLDGQNAEKQRLFFRQWISQGLARLDTWKKTGHNFLKSNEEEDLEPAYNTLYENLLFSTEKLGISLEEIRNDESYKKIVDGLMKDYNQADTSFDKKRKNTSIKKGIIHGGIYGASSLAFQWLAGTGLFDYTKTIPGGSVTKIGGVIVDPGIAQDLEKTLGAQKYKAFVDHLSQSSTPETLWKTLTTDIFQNNSVGNGMKNQIMTFILNATDVQNGITKPELLIEAAKKGLFSDIANHASSIDRIFNLLHKWGYGHVDKSWLIDTIKGIDAGTIQVGSLKPMEQTKVAEALWCYVHRDGTAAGSPLWKVFMDKLPDVVTPGAGSTERVAGGDWVKYLAIPSWANTFLSPLKKEKKPDSGSFFDPEGKPIEYPKDTPWWDESSWNEDFGKDDDTKKKWEDWNTKPKQKNDTKVVTRGDKKPLDDRDINPEYPIKDIDKTSEEVANYMIDKAPVYFGDDYTYFKAYKNGKVSREEFSKRLQVSNMEKRKELEKLMPVYNETLKHAYEGVRTVFKKNEFNMDRIMSFEKFRENVSFYTFYEFMANFNAKDQTDAVNVKGFNRLTAGKIGFNMHGLTQKPIEEQIKFIKHVAIHELLHGTAVNNYWELSGKSEPDYLPRRSGLFMFNLKKGERGRELNEGIVETLAFETMVSLFGEEYKQVGDMFYKKERECISVLMKNYDIPKKVFIQAAYERNGLKELILKLEGPNKERKGFLTLIISLMKKDVQSTLSFLNGGTFYIQKSDLSNCLHPSLLRDGSLAPKVREYIEEDGMGIRLK